MIDMVKWIVAIVVALFVIFLAICGLGALWDLILVPLWTSILLPILNFLAFPLTILAGWCVIVFAGFVIVTIVKGQ